MDTQGTFDELTDSAILTVEGDSDDESESGSEICEPLAADMSSSAGMAGAQCGMFSSSIASGICLRKNTAQRSFRSEEEMVRELQEEGELQETFAASMREKTEEVVLNCHQFEALPDDLFRCIHITRLKAHRNNLRTIQPDVARLVNLTELNVSENKLTTLPEALGSLVNLVLLDCNRNQLVSVPASISQLQKLRKLYLDYNQLTAIPEEVTEIAGLESAYFIENEAIDDFPLKMNRWQSCVLHLTNKPSLRDRWKTIKSSCPSTKIKWQELYPDQVLPFLYLGGVRSAQNASVLQELKISHVITAASEVVVPSSQWPDSIVHLRLKMTDNEDQQLAVFFDEVPEYIDSIRKENGKVLVHCFRGMSRSAALVCAYLVLRMRMPFKEAIQFVKKKRPSINPNNNFRRQLIEYEERILGTRIDPADAECFMNSSPADETSDS
ncbi:Dual specificity protein phosphatase [Diplonema papillatum]|nr:Dual specificity protein phosphatase [Diplonema papillatum]